MTEAVRVVLDPRERCEGLRLCPKVNMTTGEHAFRASFGAPTSLENDVLNLVSGIYCTDLAVRRGDREMVTRHIELHVPVVNVGPFEAVSEELRYALYRVSHDAWNISFSQAAGAPEVRGDVQAHATPGPVLLFSGGLDSLAAGVEFGMAGEHVELVGHVSGNRVVANAQRTLFGRLAKRFRKQFSYRSFRVGASNRARRGLPFPQDRDREESQRTRSVLFLGLAALAARRTGRSRLVVIAENGPMSIHLPLSAARIGAFSTHTAHPEFVLALASILSRLLGHEITIENPFLYKTKGEVVSAITTDRAMIDDSVSCWKASRVTGGLKHCGICVPCLSRRLALESQGVSIPEFRRDVLRENLGDLDVSDEGKRNLVELVDFARRFQQAGSQAELEDNFPDLVNPAFDPVRAAAMYRRFAAEVLGVVGRYPNAAPLLS